MLGGDRGWPPGVHHPGSHRARLGVRRRHPGGRIAPQPGHGSSGAAARAKCSPLSAGRRLAERGWRPVGTERAPPEAAGRLALIEDIGRPWASRSCGSPLTLEGVRSRWVVCQARPRRVVRHGHGRQRACRAGVLAHAVRVPPTRCGWPGLLRRGGALDRETSWSQPVPRLSRVVPVSTCCPSSSPRLGGSADPGNALVSARLPIVVPGPTTMGNSRRTAPSSSAPLTMSSSMMRWRSWSR